MHDNGTEYRFYDSNFDCDSCKNMCKNDTTCTGVECGQKRKCVMWTAGSCGTLEQQSRDEPTYRTCMKYDEGDDLAL